MCEVHVLWPVSLLFGDNDCTAEPKCPRQECKTEELFRLASAALNVGKVCLH